ncbi:degenerin-like protein del-10 [Tubulanus polymorphus]|uniref:degenerin-like protein del-10 n=1 Tax=Tubulanus polymorphus TaxID=672921 RepID=UPI003DA5D7F1
MTGVLCYQIYDRTTYYLSWPVTSDITVGKPETGELSFPAVTICNTNTFRLSDVEAAGFYEQISGFYSDETYNSSSSTVVQMDLRYLMLNMSHRMKDSIKEASFQSEYLDTNNFTAIFTDYGLCYSFNIDQSRNVSSYGTGIAFGLRLLINMETYQTMSGEHKSSGLRVLVHDKNEVPRVKNLGLFVPAKMMAVIGINTLQTTELPYPHGTCKHGVAPLETCLRQCHIRKAADVCQCLPYYAEQNLFDGLPYCSMIKNRDCMQLELSEVKRNSSICNSQCSIPCQKISYESQISYSSLSSYMAKTISAKYSHEETLVSDYQTSMDAIHRVDPKIKTQDLEIISQFNNDLVCVKSQINDLVTFLKGKYDRVVDASIDVYDALWTIVDELETTKKNYMKVSAVDRVEPMILTPLAEFRQALKLEVPVLLDVMRDYLLSQTGTRDEYLESSENVFDIFERVSDVQLRVYNEFNDVYLNLVEENGKSEDADPMRRFPAQLLSDELGKIKETLDQLSDRTDAMAAGSKTTTEKIQAFDSQPPTAYEWTEFENSIQNYTKYASDIGETALNLYDQLGNILTKVQNMVAKTNTHQLAIDFAYTKLLNALEEIQPSQPDLPIDIDIDLKITMDKADKNFMRPFQDVTNNGDVIGRMTDVLEACENMYYIDDLLWDLNAFLTNDFPKITSAYQELKKAFQSADVYLNDKVLSTFPSTSEIVTRIMPTIESHVSKTKAQSKRVIEMARELKSKHRKVTESRIKLIEHMAEFNESIQIDDSFIQNNFVYVNVFLRTMEIQKLSKSKAYSWFSLVCDIGGTAGLYLGASLLALVEVLFFVGNQVINSFTRAGNKPNEVNQHPDYVVRKTQVIAM